MKKDKGTMIRDLVIAGVILFVGCFMGVLEAKNAGWLGQTASVSKTLQTKDSASETGTEAEMAAKETEKPLIYNNPVYRVDHDENGNAKVTVVQDYQHKDTDKTASSYSSSVEQKSSDVSSSYSHTAGGGGGSTGSFVNGTSGTGSSSYSGSGSSSSSSYKSNSSYKSSSGYESGSGSKKKYDPYDAYDYDDADDFADDWAEEFGDGDYDDGYDDAYDYWEDEMDD